MVDRSGPQPVLGGYRLEEELGAGSTGTVWRARREGPVNQLVAVKRLRVGAAGGDVERLRREGEILAALDHPHIVRVLEVVDDDGPAVAMQYAPGGSLQDLLARRGRLSAGEVVAVAAPVADAHPTTPHAAPGTRTFGPRPPRPAPPPAPSSRRPTRVLFLGALVATLAVAALVAGPVRRGLGGGDGTVPTTVSPCPSLPAATPVWAAPAEDGFAPNVVVTAAPDPVPADATALRDDLARTVPDLRAVDVVGTDGGGLRSTAVHPTTGRDAVTVQERRPVAGATVAVAYTCVAEQHPRWRTRFTDWLDATR